MKQARVQLRFIEPMVLIGILLPVILGVLLKQEIQSIEVLAIPQRVPLIALDSAGTLVAVA